MGTAGNRNTLRRDLLVALQCGAFAALMGSLCCAAMPLWSRLCRAGGLGGTAEVAGALPHAPRLASVRFDRDLAARLEFGPPRNSVAANFKQVVTVSFRVAGAAGRIGATEAGCSVGAPGLCFEKINCLYLAPQTVRPGERVVLCVDPNRADDPGRDGVSTIMLFHTFHPADARPPVRARLTGRT
jgi:cytochrome c oxidase assembly protein Cox11